MLSEKNLLWSLALAAFVCGPTANVLAASDDGVDCIVTPSETIKVGSPVRGVL